MIVILQPNADEQSPAYQKVMDYLRTLSDVTLQQHQVRGTEKTLTEIIRNKTTQTTTSSYELANLE